jgi:hypothetical protein
MSQAALQAEILETLRTDVLEKELLRRWQCFEEGKCPYCGKPLGSEPECKATSQHQASNFIPKLVIR